MKQFLAQFPSKKILVIGDVLLDLYIHGEVERISPEAPVPIVLEKSRHYVLGGAGNVAANVAALGGRVTLASVIGADSEGVIIERLCREQGIRGTFVKDRHHPTTLKTRPIARRHQLLRIDREKSDGIPKQAEQTLRRLILRLPMHDIVIVSDYAKGCVTKVLMEALKRRFSAGHIIVGLKPKNASLYRDVALVALNLIEAEELTGIHADGNGSALRALRKLEKYFHGSIVLTRGEHGMTVYDRISKKLVHVPSRAVQVFDVTGAGDTVLAALGLSLASRATLPEAADLANHAAGIVVGLEGTATVSRKALAAAL